MKSCALTKWNKCKYYTITKRAKKHDLWSPKHNQMRFKVGVKHVVILNLFETTSIHNVLGELELESCAKVSSVKNSTMCKNYNKTH